MSKRQKAKVLAGRNCSFRPDLAGLSKGGIAVILVLGLVVAGAIGGYVAHEFLKDKTSIDHTVTPTDNHAPVIQSIESREGFLYINASDSDPGDYISELAVKICNVTTGQEIFSKVYNPNSAKVNIKENITTYLKGEDAGPGKYLVKIEAKDKYKGIATLEKIVEIPIPGNDPPEIVGEPEIWVDYQNNTVWFKANATDKNGDGDRIEMILIFPDSDANAWIGIYYNENNSISWSGKGWHKTDISELYNRTLQLVVRVYDKKGNCTKLYKDFVIKPPK